MVPEKTFRHAREIKKIMSPNRLGIIWGAGGYGLKLLQQARVLDLSLHIYDSCTEKVFHFAEKISREEIKKEINSSYFIVAAFHEKTFKEIVENILEIGGNITNVYRFLPEDYEYLNNKLRTIGFYNGSEMKHVLKDRQAKCLMEEKIKMGEPFLFSRWGSVEGNAVFADKAELFTDNDFFALQNNAGFYPVDRKTIHTFSTMSIASAYLIDILCAGCWCLNLEELYRMYSPSATLVSSAMMYPFFEEISWTNALEGKNVLIIHPFAGLMERQYLKRCNLFVSSNILPDFNLIAYQAVQSMGGNSEFPSWFHALDKMKNDIKKINFDIALIGCGAYGMLLGAFIKGDLHRQAIHMGGTLQCLFGIKGKRWESASYNYQNRLYNKYWVRPNEDLKPKNYRLVEDGCYW